MLREVQLIETVNDQLKNISQIEHTRHHSEQCVAGVSPVVATANPEGVCNFMVNAIGGLIAYTYQDKKPSLNLTTEDLATQECLLKILG